MDDRDRSDEKAQEGRSYRRGGPVNRCTIAVENRFQHGLATEEVTPNRQSNSDERCQRELVTEEVPFPNLWHLLLLRRPDRARAPDLGSQLVVRRFDLRKRIFAVEDARSLLDSQNPSGCN